MAKPGAMVDIVAAKPGAHQLLKEIGLLVRPLGRPETGKRAFPLTVADALQAAGGEVERFLPARFAKMRVRVGGVDIGVVL